MDLPKIITETTTNSASKWKEFLRRVEHVQEYELRKIHIQRLGFPIITTEVADELAKFIGDRSVIDVGARTGYISAILAERGINITAVDNYSGKYVDDGEYGKYRWYPILEQDALKIKISEYDLVLLSWPDYNTSFGYQIIYRMVPGQILIYQGESFRGCTGNDQFFDMLDSDSFEEINSDFLNENHIQFRGLHDYWWLYKRVNHK